MSDNTCLCMLHYSNCEIRERDNRVRCEWPM